MRLQVQAKARRQDAHGSFYTVSAALTVPNADPATIIEALNKRGWEVNAILNVETVE